ncbi:MAG: hypothetical protein J6D52_01850 [Clostridia bacterium]|nr:hypothetical protein [Clostridia bacterium]
MKKIISLIVFAVFYILSIYTSNFPYPEYAEHPLVSFMFSLLTIISFLFVPAAYSRSKKFLIIVSVYFVSVFIISTIMIFNEVSSLFFVYVILALIFLSFGLPITHFFNGVSDVLDFCNIHISNNYEFYIIYAIIIALFYTTYFISKKCRKEEIK